MPRLRKSPLMNVCIVCGESFLVINPNNTRKKTCSSKCLTELKSNARKGKALPSNVRRIRRSKIQEICVICGKVFDLTPSQAHEKKKTCSRECKSAYYSLKNIEKPRRRKGSKAIGVCAMCGQEFISPAHYIRNGRRFCTNECRLKWFSQQTPTGENNPYWRGGQRGYYGPTWRTARRAARERDNHSCTECGKHRNELGYEPIVHHVKPFKAFGLDRHIEANHLDNLRCYCRSCHMRLEWSLHRQTT